MVKSFSFSQFLKQFPTNEACLDEIRKLRFPKGISCISCKQVTKHYKVQGRMAYSCEYCRRQVYPLTGTIFEKTTTPLRLWFYAMFLMTHTRAELTTRELQKELGVTYKTAWRISHNIKILMQQNNGDLLSDAKEVLTWTLFNTFEFKVVQKKEEAH